jgi:class 3 adenylate cyclase
LEPGPAFIYRTVSSVAYSLSATMLALIIAVAIFRQGLLDIDFILRRTVVYTALTVIVLAGFVFVSSLANNTLETLTGQRSELVPLVTALPFAILFVPLRSALIRLANRFMSGRKVLTVLFVDISGSTALAVRIGDRAWRDLLDRFRSIVRRELKRFGGDEVDTAGDGFFATFAGPEGAIRCALVIVGAVRHLGIEARAGAHVGEVEVSGADVSGVAVHVGARLVALARPGEVLVSESLRNLIAGSNIELRDEGEHELKGVPGASRVYAA